MEKPVNDLTVVVLGAHLLTRSMHMEITSLLRHSPGYCFFVQSLREPSALFMMESEGVRFISQDTPLFPVDSATAPSDAVSRAVTALLRRSSHCVFSQVDLSLTSAKLVSAAAAGLGVTVFMMHSAQRLHKSYERFTNTLLDFGNDPTALDTSTKSSNIVKSSVIDGISIIHMVHFAIC